MDTLKLHKNASKIGLLAIVLLGLLLHSHGLGAYFFQDDWFILNLVQNSSIIDLIGINNEVIYYRPIGMFFFFKFAYGVFGLNSFYFHIISHLFFAASITLVYMIGKMLLGSSKSGLVAAFIFATSSAHFMTSVWLALTWNNIGTFCVLLSIYLFQGFKKNNNKFYYALSVISHLFALLSTEFAISTPFIILALNYALSSPKKWYLKDLAPMFMLSAAYAAFRLLFISSQHVPQYSVGIGLNVFGNLFWYSMWLLNLPEVLKHHISVSALQFSNDPTLIGPIKKLLWPLILGFSSTILFLAVILIKTREVKKILTLIFVSLFPLIPVVILRGHSFTYYLVYSLIGFSLMTAYFLKKSNKTFLAFFLMAWILTSYTTVKFQQRTHWVSAEAAISKKIMKEIENKITSETKIIYLFPKSEMVENSLMGQEAVNFVFPTSQIIYLDEAPEVYDAGSITINLNEI